jgi:hypothetical protein
MLAYAAGGSALFAGLFTAFTILRADPGAPCPWDHLIETARQPDFLVTSMHPPPYRSRATEPLADCASVVRLQAAGPEDRQASLDEIRAVLAYETHALGLSLTNVEPSEGASRELVFAYTTFCAHRAEMTAQLIAAVHTTYPGGTRLIDITDSVDTQSIVLPPTALPLWPEPAP